jgi:hypothetical protein
MKVKITDSILTPDSNDIPVSPQFHGTILQTDKLDWLILFQNFRLNFRSRIGGCRSNDDLLKLQGKLETIEELQTFFIEMLKTQKD